MKTKYISIKNCKIADSKNTFIEKLDWELNSGEFWLVFGENGGGKADFLHALCGQKFHKTEKNVEIFL